MYGCRPFCADQRTAEGDLGTEPMLGRLSTSRGEFPTMKKSGGGGGEGGVYLEMPLLGFTTWMSMEVTDHKLVSNLVVHFTYLTDVSNLLIQG